MPLYMLGSMLVFSSHFAAKLILDEKYEDWTGIEREKERPPLFWWFNCMCLFATLLNGIPNGMFLWFAFWDANRRIWLMR